MSGKSFASKSTIRPLLAGAAVALLIAACSSYGQGRTGTDAAPSGTLVAQQDGLELRVSLTQTAVAPGEPVQIDMVLRNNRDADVMYDTSYCFGGATVTVALPLEPAGKTWDGQAGAFKEFALHHGYGGGGVSATDPVVLQIPGTGCSQGNNFEAPLGAGNELHASFKWRAEYVTGVPVIPQTVPFTVDVGYDRQNGPRSYAPDYTGIHGSWVAEFKRITIHGQITVHAPAIAVVTFGQAVDAALGDADFLALVELTPGGACPTVNVYLVDNQGGGILADGPAWMVESICDEPRHFDIVAIDPITGDVSGSIMCPDPCDR